MEKLKPVRSKKERDKLVRDNIKLVFRFSRLFFKNKKHRGYFYSLEDAQGDACLGLIRAAELYQPRKEIKFSTYAFFWMRQIVDRSYAKAKTRGLTRLPKEYEIHFGRLYQEDRLEKELYILNPAETQLEDKEIVDELLKHLPELWKKITLQKMKGKSSPELAKHYKVSHQRINQIHEQARERLKEIAVRENIQ